MKSIRRYCLAGSLLFSVYANSAAAAGYHFKDMTSVPWAASSIEVLYQAGMINGVSATEFSPNTALTRAQFAALMANIQKGSYQEKSLPFTDIDSKQWYYQSVKKMYSMGMIKGVSATKFQPNRTITREEAASLIARTFDNPHNDVALPFKDQGDISDWALDSVKKGAAKGLFAVFGDQFRPHQAITRAETAVILHKLLFGEPATSDQSAPTPVTQSTLDSATAQIATSSASTPSLTASLVPTAPLKPAVSSPSVTPTPVISSPASPTVDPAPAILESPSLSVDPAPTQPEATPLASRGSDLLTQRVNNVVQSVLGVPYRYGGNTPAGMDCSGLTSYIYKQFGVDLPRQSESQFAVGTAVSVNSMKKGDLIFFDTGQGVISHVGMYMGDNKMVHAASKPAEVTISDLDWYLSHYKVVGVKRIFA